MPKIKIASIDWDGCLSHASYQTAVKADFHNKPEERRKFPDLCIEHNPLLINKLKELGINKIMVGSNRQDIRGDSSDTYVREKETIYQTGSSYPNLQEIATHIGAEFDTFLLGDLYSGLEPGATHKAAIALQKDYNYPPDFKCATEGKKVSEWEFEKNKISLIYAQIQKLALQHPNDEVEYTFFDDRKEILEAIENFFRANPEMIPGNVKIKTYRYYNTVESKDRNDSVMKLEERETLESNPTVKANPNYDLTLRLWAHKSMDQTKQGQLVATPELYAALREAHDTVVETPRVEVHKIAREAKALELKNAVFKFEETYPGYGKIAEKVQEILVDKSSSKKFGGASDWADLRNNLIKLYQDAWDRELKKGKLTTGYSAVLRDITRELSANYPDILKNVKESLRFEYERQALEQNSGPYHHGQLHMFLQEDFEKDWNKFTGANASLFQRFAKTIVQQFKKPPEEESDQERENVGLH
ncbi:hypothetical protein [Legionella bozemanae]|uniref:Dot/Icm T4SS effector n=1 Tax=Legionella bozemanae TaxID=447 RepID=A0A0W0RF31_LEGBO|nr:hypothetical protein [Legionella bozemanae]KTC69642.1 Dot/Icm T4SS effector [Legionella bozemanae]STO33127.1 Uncharacterised protein [Legionella bozemanae]